VPKILDRATNVLSINIALLVLRCSLDRQKCFKMSVS